MLVIGSYQLKGRVLLAPMAGVTDLPFRRLCRRLGAALAVSEMVSSKPELRHTPKTRWRLCHTGEDLPVAVQIVGTEPWQLAEAARFNVKNGAQIIDINMGCPAKKVCTKMAGSALMKDPSKVKAILSTVVAAVTVPVTLKIRSGWDSSHKNALQIAKIAEDCGIAALAIHGRTRSCPYRKPAEYETIKQVKQSVGIPVIANGDIDSVEKARFVLQYTGADALMIGRAARQKPWIFNQINIFLGKGEKLPEPENSQKIDYLLELLQGIYTLYGESQGVRIARKHIHAMTGTLIEKQGIRQQINQVDNATQQIQLVKQLITI